MSEFFSDPDPEADFDDRRSESVSITFVRITGEELEQINETIDALARGRITPWHAEQVTPEMLRAYLEGAEGWACYLDHELGTSWRFCDDYTCNVEAAASASTTQRSAFVLRTASEAEQRGELAVWLDVMAAGEPTE